ncbi:ATP-binding protein [Nocardioides mesophilus]|uniref:ATP-binding protein n=1 Tax=Nocardioides mesophilus TaxID=433659 RepID=A0A7G9RA05_9ACTN|nr:ATP-binding protein [Nocardioides mesophilus]QNN52430.1 ATP-binding protein [Nocardioides mesophilus]
MTSSVLWSDTACFPPVPLSAPRARDFVSVRLTEHHLPQLQDAVRLVVSELVTNAIVHAGTPLTVTIEELASQVRVAVHDESPTAPCARTAHQDDTGGRGLAVIERFSSAWGVLPGTRSDKSVWASFAVPPLVPRSRRPRSRGGDD